MHERTKSDVTEGEENIYCFSIAIRAVFYSSRNKLPVVRPVLTPPCRSKQPLRRFIFKFSGFRLRRAGCFTNNTHDKCTMSNAVKYLLSVGIMGGSLLGGYILMKSVTPDPDELLSRLPESDPEKMAESKQRTKELMAALKAAAESPHPIYKTIKRD